MERRYVYVRELAEDMQQVSLVWRRAVALARHQSLDRREEAHLAPP